MFLRVPRWPRIKPFSEEERKEQGRSRLLPVFNGQTEAVGLNGTGEVFMVHGRGSVISREARCVSDHPQLPFSETLVMPSGPIPASHESKSSHLFRFPQYATIEEFRHRIRPVMVSHNNLKRREDCLSCTSYFSLRWVRPGLRKAARDEAHWRYGRNRRFAGVVGTTRETIGVGTENAFRGRFGVPKKGFSSISVVGGNNNDLQLSLPSDSVGGNQDERIAYAFGS